LAKLVPISHIVFGTDSSFTAAMTVAKAPTDYGFSAGDLRAIEREIAVMHFPKRKDANEGSQRQSGKPCMAARGGLYAKVA